MADFICQGCGAKHSGSSSLIHKCDKCGKVLCGKCRGSKYNPCSTAIKGTPKCSGTYRNP